MFRPEIIERGHEMMWLGGIWWVLVVGLLVLGAVVIARTVTQHGGSFRSAGSDSPLRILEERYAKGEIDEDEFKARRAVLRG